MSAEPLEMVNSGEAAFAIQNVSATRTASKIAREKKNLGDFDPASDRIGAAERTLVGKKCNLISDVTNEL